MMAARNSHGNRRCDDPSHCLARASSDLPVPRPRMARYKHIETGPRLVPVDLARQLLPGTFEHAVW